MKLDQVQIKDFRNINSEVLNPSQDLNFIFGQNGSGKSSLLEAIHYLGFARSFRTSKHKNVIQQEKHNFSVFGKCVLEGEVHKLGISRSIDDKVTVSIDGIRSNKTSELVSNLPVQIFTPQSSDLIIGSPGLRRKYLDWGLFHVEHSFGAVSANYRNVLKNKNALLKNLSLKKSSEEVSQEQFWDNKLVELGNLITNMRSLHIESLEPHINANLMQLLPEFCVEISYYRGWEKERSLQEALEYKNERDKRNGFLSVGPHKADIKIKTKGVDAAEVMSRGQLRMLVAALQLAQIQLLNENTNKSSVFLLDDVGAELDSSKRELFIDNLIECNAQLFVTAIEKEQVSFIEKYKNKKMFHVEHGHVIEEI